MLNWRRNGMVRFIRFQKIWSRRRYDTQNDCWNREKYNRIWQITRWAFIYARFYCHFCGCIGACMALPFSFFFTLSPSVCLCFFNWKMGLFKQTKCHIEYMVNLKAYTSTPTLMNVKTLTLRANVIHLNDEFAYNNFHIYTRERSHSFIKLTISLFYKL